MDSMDMTTDSEFQSTHPVRGATADWNGYQNTMTFQSTHPVRGATGAKKLVIGDWVFQSTHPVRGATVLINKPHQAINVSIHAPREGCDVKIRTVFT